MLKRVFCSCLLLCALHPVLAQSPLDFALVLETAYYENNEHDILVVGSWAVDDVWGWSWGVCHNAGDAVIASWEMPHELATASLRDAEPGYHTVNVYEDGIIQAVLTSFSNSWGLDATERFELLKIHYVCSAEATVLEFCETLGEPPVEVISSIPDEFGLAIAVSPAIQEGGR